MKYKADVAGGSRLCFTFLPPGHTATLLGAGVARMDDRQDGPKYASSRPGPLESPVVILEVVWENGRVTSWKRPVPESPLGGELSN